MVSARYVRWLVFALVAVMSAIGVLPCQARTTLKNICRLKGQEENTLQGIGLVIGLKGTGDGAGSLPTMRSLATVMRLMGNPIDKKFNLELKEAKNVALVMVTATVPSGGARQGD